jgi:hypothetical protein
MAAKPIPRDYRVVIHPNPAFSNPSYSQRRILLERHPVRSEFGDAGSPWYRQVQLLPTGCSTGIRALATGPLFVSPLLSMGEDALVRVLPVSSFPNPDGRSCRHGRCLISQVDSPTSQISLPTGISRQVFKVKLYLLAYSYLQSFLTFLSNEWITSLLIRL